MGVDISGNSLYWKARVDNTQLATDTTKTKTMFSGLKSSITSLNVFAGLSVSAVLAFKKIIEVNKDFESAMSSLEAITGATDDQLKFLKESEIMAKNIINPTKPSSVNTSKYEL